MKTFSDKLNEASMAYTDFFGKKISHEAALAKTIKDDITQVIVDDRKISEKAFESYDKVIQEVKQFISEHPEILEKANNYYKEGRRLQFLAEEVFDTYFRKKV